jgi:SIT4-associating protein SAP185/190
MFWRFGGYSNISTIDTLLDKPDLKLEDLLEESDLIQELKSHHTKLIEFLRDDDNLHALLQYVIAPPPKRISGEHDEPEEEYEGDHDQEQDESEKKRLKYAYVACEILSCETWSITEALMANIQHLTEFWDFLRSSPTLEPLQAGYFTKVNECLLEKKTEDMLDFFKSLPGIVPAILQHVDCPMVMDLLLKIISLEKSDGGIGIVDWLQSQDLIPMLLSNLSPECNSSTQTSAGDFLKAIITISANAAQDQQSCIGPNSLTRQLVSESCVETLVSAMLRGGNPLTVGVGIVIEVIRKNNSDYDPEGGTSADQPPTNHDPIYLGTLLRLFAKNVPNFMELILSSKHTVTEGDATRIVDRGELKSAWGTSIEPLGFDRFKTCELMAELLHCSNMGLLNERGSEEFIKARDEERERLRAQGLFQPPKQYEESTVDISATSSRFENAFTPSASTEELRIANNSEDDGFEKVAAPTIESAASSSTLDKRDDLVDEPLSPARSQHADTKAIDDPASPTKGLSNDVRRLSLEDTSMTSPPGEKPVPASPQDPTSPHPEDKPAPLFASKDPNKTPTPSSPEPPQSPLSTKSGHHISQLGNPSTQPAEDSTMQGDESVITDEQPVVGDHLKIMFVENHVVPTILSFFFRFPWNNFLHNVVYDVVQQVFNGPMDRGYNRFLAYDLFETGHVTQAIIEGQKRSDEAEQTKNMRLGYMGHLTLVAEEVVKFGERQARDQLSPAVQDAIYGKEWEEHVTKTLAETRERDNAILGGFRPENGLGPRQAVLNAVNSGSRGGSNALANAGLGGGQPLDSIELGNSQFGNSGSATSQGFSSGSLSGFGSSSDDDDEDMDDVEEEERNIAAQEDPNAPVPLIPPPPAPLNIEPSRARRRLADRLARKQEAEQQEAAASEFGSESDDPFGSLNDADEQGSGDPFSLDEEEQDITAFGKRSNNNPFSNSSNSHAFSASRGLTSLFSSGKNDGFDDLDRSSSDSGSDIEADNPPLEARTSLERRPLDIDDDEEMGEMVAPSEEGPNSSDEEVLSPNEKERLGNPFGRGDRSPDEHVSEFDGQGDEDQEDQLVEIAMPTSSKRRSRG